MRGSLVVASMLVLAFGACASPALDAPNGEHSERTGTLREPIITAQRSAAVYPEAVRVKVNNVYNDFCSGVIVAPKVVLTASHCIVFNPGSTWTLEAPYTSAGSQTRTASSAEPYDAAFYTLTRSNFDQHPELHDIGFLYVDAAFTNVPVAVLSATRWTAGTQVAAVGRASATASAGLALSTVQTLSLPTAGDYYTREYKTPWITGGGDSGGPLFVEGTHSLVGTERVFDATTDHWSEVYGGVQSTVLARIASHGGFTNVSPGTPTAAPQGNVAFSVAAGSGGPYAWSFTTNASGATLDASSGAYRAGTTSNVSDVVTVTDGAGNKTNVTVSVGPGVGISPSSLTLAPLGARTFVASGGSSASYAWSFTTNASGATLNGSTGAYKAGTTGSVVDVLKVTDSLGNAASVNVSVSAALAISPLSPVVAPRATRTFAASGGTGAGTYSFDVLTNASVNASIGLTSGFYTAGATGSTVDVVRVRDTNGAESRANVSVTAGVVLTPAAPSAPVRGSLALGATGGTGTGYVFSFDGNASGGTLSSAGAYRAGDVGNVNDLVRVVDSLGNFAVASIAVGRPLGITTAGGVVAPRGRVTFAGIGGSGAGYTWTLSQNGSHGTIDATSGVYIAGNTPDMRDVITLTDSLGNTATVDENVGDGVTLTPRALTLTAGANITLHAAGGSATGYAYSFAKNQSGATLDALSGAYVAGEAGGTDSVLVTDSLGNTDATDFVISAKSVVPSPAAPAAPPVDMSSSPNASAPPATSSTVTTIDGGASSGCAMAASSADSASQTSTRACWIACGALGAFVVRSRRRRRV